MIQWRIMRPSITRYSRQLDPRCSTTDVPPPQSATLGVHPIPISYLSFPTALTVGGWVGLSTQQSPSISTADHDWSMIDWYKRFMSLEVIYICVCVSGWMYRNGRPSLDWLVSRPLFHCLPSIMLHSTSLELRSDFPLGFSSCMR